MSKIETAAVRRAAEICGEQALAICLDATRAELMLWMQGDVVPPQEVFSRVAIILADHAEGFEQPNPGWNEQESGLTAKRL